MTELTAPSVTCGHDPERRDPSRQGIVLGGRRELILTLSEVADILKCDVRTVKKLIRDGALFAIRVSPRITRVTERALGEYLHPAHRTRAG